MENITELFVEVDDFWKAVKGKWEEHLLTKGDRKRLRKTKLSESEIMTILILFHQARYCNFKTFYLEYVWKHLRREFPDLVSYKRFVGLMDRVGALLVLYLQTRLGKCTGISFVDSTSIKVCHNQRINRNRIFKGWATRGKSRMGWFYGFKLHLVVNQHGEIIAFSISPANQDDRATLQQFAPRLFGKLFADKGYLSNTLRNMLSQLGISLITSIRKNMKPQILTLQDKLWLRRRSIIETINDQLKNLAFIEHSRHRRVDHFFINLVSGLIAYSHQPKKPSVHLDPDLFLALSPSF